MFIPNCALDDTNRMAQRGFRFVLEFETIPGVQECPESRRNKSVSGPQQKYSSAPSSRRNLTIKMPA